MARKQKQLLDETRYCEHCGISYIWTIEEQRALSMGVSATPAAFPLDDEFIDNELVDNELVDEMDEMTSDEERVHALEEQESSAAPSEKSSEEQLPTLPLATNEPPHYCPGCRHLMPTTERERGLVKWYNRRKGYGFIVRQNAPEIFVNRSAIRRGHLLPNDFVEFTVGRNQQGPAAFKVTVLKPDPK